ncbi:MAG TPA: hypothetical protein VLE44_02830 [Candidatus Saccharimonadales bacterium]|nr:hypothetical protein [Candidatus Saccharimonadales bacterium]
MAIISVSLSGYQFLQSKNTYQLAITSGSPVAGSDTCGPSCQSYINEVVRQYTGNSPMPSTTPSAAPKPTSTPQVVYQTQTQAPKITYIPLSGGQTQNTDWVDISSSAFTLNIGDYGSKASAVWDATIRVGNANGTTYVRLFDKTHGITVNGSEISITDTATSTDVVSGTLSFWAGSNSYVVQIKSLNSSTAFMDSGRIKVSY